MTLEMWRALRFYAKAAMLIYQDRTGEKVRKVPKHLRTAVVSYAAQEAARMSREAKP